MLYAVRCTLYVVRVAGPTAVEFTDVNSTEITQVRTRTRCTAWRAVLCLIALPCGSFTRCCVDASCMVAMPVYYASTPVTPSTVRSDGHRSISPRTRRGYTLPACPAPFPCCIQTRPSSRCLVGIITLHLDREFSIYVLFSSSGGTYFQSTLTQTCTVDTVCTL